MENQEPVRVAQIIGKWVGGGVESVVMNYYRYIDRTKIQFDFICDEDSSCIPYEEIENLGGKVILIPPYQKVIKYQKELIKIFRENNYKIVHSHINTLSIFPLRAAKKARVPVRIAHSHSTIINDKKEFKRNVLKNILKYFSKIFATDFFACSKSAAISQFGKKTYDEGKVIILNNAIDLDKFKYDKNLRSVYRNKFGIKKDTFVIGHVGRFVTTKNHSFLIDLFSDFHKENKNSVLILAGQGPLEESIKAKVNQLDLKDSVLFLGQIQNANILYQVFDLFLLPSLYEGLGIVLIEAQASNLNCIVSNGIPYEAKLVDNFKFISLDADKFKWKNEIIKMKGKYIRKSNEMILTERGFNIRVESKKLEKYYKKCLLKIV